jgi:hypothetical protein
LDVNIGFEEGIHLVVETCVETHAAIPTETYVSARAFSLRVETPRNIVLCSFLDLEETGGAPAASFGFALRLIDAHVTAVSA